MEGKNASLSLKAWIVELGEPAVAKLLRVNQSAVGHWLRGYCIPTATLQLKIMKITKGDLTPTKIVVDHFKRSNTKRWVTAKRKKQTSLSRGLKDNG